MVQTASGSEGIISVNICGKTSSWYALTLSTVHNEFVFQNQGQPNIPQQNSGMIKGVYCTFKSGMEGANLWPGKWILHFDNADSPTKHFHENDFWSKKKTPTPFMLMFPKLNHIIDKVMLQTI